MVLLAQELKLGLSLGFATLVVASSVMWKQFANVKIKNIAHIVALTLFAIGWIGIVCTASLVIDLPHADPDSVIWNSKLFGVVVTGALLVIGFQLAVYFIPQKLESLRYTMLGLLLGAWAIAGVLFSMNIEYELPSFNDTPKLNNDKLPLCLVGAVFIAVSVLLTNLKVAEYISTALLALGWFLLAYGIAVIKKTAL